MYDLGHVIDDKVPAFGGPLLRAVARDDSPTTPIPETGSARTTSTG
jgi:hypothetical protein